MPAGTIVLRDQDQNGIDLDNILLLPSGGMTLQSGHMPSSILITVEAALSPCLFPDAKGTWKDSPDYVCATHYHKIRLLGPDPRFRQCPHYIFFLFDRYLRRRLASTGVQIKHTGEAVQDDALEAGCPPYNDDALRDLLGRVQAIQGEPSIGHYKTLPSELASAGTSYRYSSTGQHLKARTSGVRNVRRTSMRSSACGSGSTSILTIQRTQIRPTRETEAPSLSGGTSRRVLSALPNTGRPA